MGDGFGAKPPRSAGGGRTLGGPRHWRVRAGLRASTVLVPVLAGGTAQAQSGPFLYVPNVGDNNVSVVDTSTNLVASSAIPVGNGPFTAGVRGDGSLVYVTNFNSNTVT